MAEAPSPSQQKYPAYVSFKAFEQLIEQFRGSGIVPTRIDRGLMPKASGSLISALLSSLRWLGLIDESSRPTERLRTLVNRPEDERAATYAEITKSAYPFLFEDEEFDLSAATTQQLAQKFREHGITGSTVTKSIVFFLHLAKAASIPLSPYLKAPAAPKSAGAKRRTATRKEAGADANGAEDLDSLPDEQSEGVERFEIPIPGKTSVKVIVPSDLDADDWEMLQSMITVYIKRWKGFQSGGPS